MMILLKIVLSLLFFLGIYMIVSLYKDFKATRNTEQYEDLSLLDKIKMKSILFFYLMSITVFCSLMVYYIITI